MLIQVTLDILNKHDPEEQLRSNVEDLTDVVLEEAYLIGGKRIVSSYETATNDSQSQRSFENTRCVTDERLADAVYSAVRFACEVYDPDKLKRYYEARRKGGQNSKRPKDFTLHMLAPLLSYSITEQMFFLGCSRSTVMRLRRSWKVLLVEEQEAILAQIDTLVERFSKKTSDGMVDWNIDEMIEEFA